MLTPAGGAGADGLDFSMGQALFERPWVAAPASTQAADGLGPLYNARSCAACHPGAGRGRPPAGEDPEDQGIGFVLRLNDDPVYGRQFQTRGTPGQLPEGRVTVTYRDEKVAFPDGSTAVLKRPIYGTADHGYGPMAAGTALSPRVASRLHGLGLLERIPEADILALEDPDDHDGDGISGRANRIGDALGRFGRKANHPTLSHQDAEAFSLDIGMSTPLVPTPWGDCTEAQVACRAAKHGDSPQFEGLEIPSALLALVDSYLHGLPPAGAARVKSDLEGATLFAATGCAACHRPSFGIRAGSDAQTIHAHSDLLLHDMGDDLADGVPAAEASGREWRTAPLWGLNALAAEDGRLALLHDGRARSIEEAVLWHGGEAAKARDRYMTLSRTDRQRLVLYVLTR